MKKMEKLLKKGAAALALLALVAGSLMSISGGKVAEAAPAWNLSGNYTINMEYLGTLYPHDMSLSQDGSGNLTGNGGSPAGANVYTWVITSGSIDGNTFSFDANYTATADAVTPQTVLHVDGAVAEDGTLSGTWSDNYQGGDRSGSWSSSTGNAVVIEAPSTVKVTIVKYIDGAMATSSSAGSADFTMNAAWSADNIGSGSGQYTLGPTTDTPYQTSTVDMSSGATYSTSEVMNSVVAATCDTDSPFSLVGYSSGDTLLAATTATPTAVAPAFTNITSDKFVVVWNHDCSAFVTTNAATGISDSDATLNGMNGNSAAIGHSFWASTSTFSTASPSLPANVFSTPDLGPIAANTAFSALLSSVSGLPAITANTTYYFAAWSNVGGVWHPGQVLNFTTGDGTGGTIGGTVGGQGVLKVDSVETVKDTATADGTFGNGWKYVFHITVPTDETNLAMKFADWARTGGGGTIPAANNIRISSAQADNGGATILITAANTYSTPDLHMVTDLDAGTDGLQTQVTVEVAIPSGTPSGAYTTSYGVRTE
jgi:hypothetical protein